ncbi:MAG TPA: signal peptide peptidase SppA [Tepidisphaeraceae bacterium]|nr:signal peptide peptidase SppA [Tepidisphaeraceae bacterium]
MTRLLMPLFVLLLLGCAPPALLIRPVFDADRLEEITVDRGGGAKIAVIPIDGMIANARGFNPLGPGENRLALFQQQLDRAARDSAVKAVVLRINSPGGTVTGSDAIYELVRRFREKSGKPVVASIQEVGASGAYYVALASDEIHAQPTSVVGSIGVIFNAVSIEGSLRMLGVRTEAIKSGQMKDMGSPFHNLTEDERGIMQAMVDEYFGRFESLVANHRKLNGARLTAVTDGRVFSGAQGLEHGLIDQLGTLDDSIDRARSLASVPKARAVMYRRPYSPGGSVYANAGDVAPRATQINLIETDLLMPSGFYYVWRP